MLNQNHFLQRSREYSYQSRIDIINTIYNAKGGHVGGSLSLIDILSSLYSLKSEYDFEFILSKGHCLLAWLVTLIRVEELDESILADFYTNQSRFGGHPKKDSSSSITWSTGSLGHGLSVAIGKAFANRNKKYICVIGDGEMNEGSIWEGLMFLAQHNLKNLMVIIDNNKQESLTFTEEILGIENLELRISGFGLKPKRICGHNHEKLIKEFLDFHQNFYNLEMPLFIIADTIKGKGVSFMERVPKWHHRKLTEKEHFEAIAEIHKTNKNINKS